MTKTLADTAENLTVDAPSATFTYRRFGPRSGVPIVLLQRFRGTIDHWDPYFLDLLAAEHDIIVMDNVGFGYTTGEPRTTPEGFADGVAEFIEALELGEVDLLGWSFGGVVAQHVALRRPELVRKLVVAGSGPGTVPGMEPLSERVLDIITKPTADDDEDLLYLFYPETEEARASGREHLARIAKRLGQGAPGVSPAAVMAQLETVQKIQAVPFDRVRANLESIKQPTLYANGVHDVMIPAVASYVAVQHLPSAVLVLYSDAGHAFLFQHAEDFVAEVTRFLRR